ncbi:MAG: DUF349 domain-containing protein [Bacteroidales bacterium]|nr:DUF349 domain-containing protein [Bacteroidales bacterium]
MEAKNLNDQNPEMADFKHNQEEKPQVEVNSASDKKNTKSEPKDSKKVSSQIVEKEKDTISKQVGSKVLKNNGNSHPRKEKIKVSGQIDEPLHQQILDLLKGFEEEKPDGGQQETVKKKVVIRQIEEVDHKLILTLIRDTNISKKPSDSSSSEEVDIDYDQLNKQELVDLLEEVVLETDAAKIKNQVAQIKVAFYRRNKEDIENKKQDFIASGGDEESYEHILDPLEVRFQNAFNVYRHNKAKYAEELENVKQTNLKEKYRILEDLKNLINSEETLKRTYDEFQNLQEEWKQVGLVPASELNDLWQNYHFLVEKFFDKVRINKELRDLDLKKNLEKKIELCEKAEELLKEDSILKSFKALQKFHEEWREVGPVPRESNDEVWERFKTATEKINERRRDHYKELQESQNQNLDAKENLCEQAEVLVAELNCSTISDWEKATEKVDGLMKSWKSVGRAPKSKNDEVWKRFKKSLDLFYEQKRDFFGEIKKQQVENYNLKLKLCERAEALQESDSWKNTTDELINLQKEWKKIGPVPRKYSDKIWKRFRAACDVFFGHKSDFYKDRRHDEEDNLKKKQEVIEAVKSYKASKSKDENIEALKEFQRQWQEIGHVVFKEKDKIYKQYKNAISELTSKLGVSNNDMSISSFENKIEGFKNSFDTEHSLLKERAYLVNKLKKLKDDIILWENNIGFFSDSKQSNVFKAEFEKKIEDAKKNQYNIQDKIKLIDKELEG